MISACAVAAVGRGKLWRRRNEAFSRNDEPVGSRAGHDTEVSKHASVEGVLLAGRLQRVLKVLTENPINPHHLRHGRLAAIPDESVAEFSKNTTHRAVMNVYVCAVDIAERFVNAVGH